MSYEKKFVVKMLDENNVKVSHIRSVNASGQKKVFFITVGDAEYVFKMINITINEVYNEFEEIVEFEEEFANDKNIVIKEKIERIKNELEMAKNVSILPQLKLIDTYKIYNDEDEYYLYYIEEKFEGVTLNSLYKKGVFSINEVIDFIEQMVKMVEIMYNCKYIHRDIKPLNIIKNNCKYSLIDGGLCKRLDEDNNLTRTPQFIGTYRYSAPEQEKRNSNYNWDYTTDLYPIGLIAIELYVKEARSYSEEHLKDLDYIYSKWKTDDKNSNYLFSKIISRLCNPNRSMRFNTFEEIYKLLEEVKKIGSDKI